jgi:hypothetical protein
VTVVQGLQGEGGVRVGATGAHLRGHPDRLHDLLRARALALGQPGVPADAVRALGGVRDRDRDQLLGLLRQRALGEDRRAERSKASWMPGASSLRRLEISGVVEW